MPAPPEVSRAAGEAYGMFPGLRDALPPNKIEAIGDFAEFLDALNAVDPSYGQRLVAEGHPHSWFGTGEAA